MDPALASLLVKGFKTREKTVLQLEAAPGGRTAAVVLRALSGRVIFRKHGLCSVFPVRETGPNMAAEVGAVNEADFAYLAGVMTALRGTLLTEEPAFSPTREWQERLRRGACGYLEVGVFPESVGASGVWNPHVYRAGPEADPDYFAGVATGSLLRRRDTDIRFSDAATPPALTAFLALFAEAGGDWLPLTDGFRILGFGHERLAAPRDEKETVCG